MGIGRWFKRQWALEREIFIDMALDVGAFIVIAGPLIVAIALMGPK